MRTLSNVIGVDDAPFPARHSGSVKVVGAVYARNRLDGILVGEVEKDGTDGARKISELISGSKFAGSVQPIMLQGVALAGFNVVDVFFLHATLGLPVLVVSRKIPDLKKVKQALLNLPGGAEKWDLIQRLGPMEPVEKVHVQRVGLTLDQAAKVVQDFTLTGHIPEPLRTAHLIAGALATGQSRGRV